MKTLAKVIAITLLALGIVTFMPVQLRTQPARADVSDKYDGDCTGHETTGRCADKCPADTTEGAYFLRGYDKETGAAVCGFSYFNACPYTEAVSADDPLCYKNQPAQPTPAVTATVPPADPNQCGGMK